jgi:hypothetical protein
MSTSGTDSVYTVTIELPDNQSHAYRFVNGDDASGLELVPAFCGVPNTGGGYDRSVYVPEHDTILDLVCFGQCDTCGAIITEIYVTFRVDMSMSIVSPEGVHLAGSFQGWDPSATPMNPGPNNVYSITLPFDFEEYHEYRFINGISWENAETVPAGCAQNDNRYVDVPNYDTLLAIVCFSDCGPCNVGVHGGSSNGFSLDQNVPNPCSDYSGIGFSIDVPGYVRLVVYDSRGVAVNTLYDGYFQEGSYSMKMDTRGLKPGIYTYVMHFSGDGKTGAISKKMIRL